MVNGKNNEKAF